MPARPFVTRLSAPVILLIASTGALTVGCGGKDQRVTVSGTVTVKGQPLTKGVVWLQTQGGSVTQAMVQPDGTFSATDVGQGEVTVAVDDDVMDKEHAKDPSKAKAPRSKSAPIPTKYRDLKTSGLRFTIGPDPQPIALNLD